MILYRIQTSLDNNYYVVAKNIQNVIEKIKLQPYESIIGIIEISKNIIIGE